MARMCPTLAVSQSKPSSSSITPQYIRLSYIHSSGARANKYLDLVANVVGVLLQSKSSNEPQGPVAQLGARFHGMEEVDGSNPSRSTKVFTYLPLYPLGICVPGVHLESKYVLGYVMFMCVPSRIENPPQPSLLPKNPTFRSCGPVC